MKINEKLQVTRKINLGTPIYAMAISVHTVLGAETGHFILRLPTVTFSRWHYLHSSEMCP
jgi:hypothetical protein